MRPASALVSAAAVLLCCAAAPLPGWRPHAARQRVPAAGKMPAIKRTVSLNGVSLTYDTALAPAVTAALAPASPLESATDKPDWFWPEHTLFDLSSAYAAPPAHARPELRVSAVEDFRRAASVSQEVEAAVVRELRDLRRFLRSRQPAPSEIRR